MKFPTLPIPPHPPRRPSAGPWRSHDTHEGEWVVDIPNDGEITVTRLFFGDMETNTGRDIANADLVAAAPDLLDAIRRWLEYDLVDLSDACEYGLNDAGGCTGDAPHEPICPACQLRAALAKADGGGQ